MSESRISKQKEPETDTIFHSQGSQVNSMHGLAHWELRNNFSKVHNILLCIISRNFFVNQRFESDLNN